MQLNFVEPMDGSVGIGHSLQPPVNLAKRCRECVLRRDTRAGEALRDRCGGNVLCLRPDIPQVRLHPVPPVFGALSSRSFERPHERLSRIVQPFLRQSRGRSREVTACEDTPGIDCRERQQRRVLDTMPPKLLVMVRSVKECGLECFPPAGDRAVVTRGIPPTPLSPPSRSIPIRTAAAPIVSPSRGPPGTMR